MAGFSGEQFNLNFSEPVKKKRFFEGPYYENPDQAEKILAEIGVPLNTPGNQKDHDFRQLQYEAVKGIAEGRKKMLAHLIVKDPELFYEVKGKKKNLNEFNLDFYKGLLPDDKFSELKEIESKGSRVDISVIPLTRGIPSNLNFVPYAYIFAIKK